MPESGSKEFILDSGARMVVTVAPFAQAKGLLNVLLREIKGGAIGGLDVGSIKDVKGLGDLMGRPELLQAIVDGLMSVASSPAVDAAVFECGERAVYENVKVSPRLFDDVTVGAQARQDAFAIYAKIIEVNVGPFFGRLFSGLKAASLRATDASPKSPSA